MSKELLFKVERSARVWTHGELTKQTKRIWIVAHGYGQLSKYFIQNFEHLDPKENFVIAPEALSRAYINGFTGRVGASWMTKELREEEIEDYINYIDLVFNQLTKEIDLKEVSICAFGFSQGAATISRWAKKNKLMLKLICLWGGQPAQELFFNEEFNNLTIIFVLGTKDAYISAEMKAKLIDQSEKSNWSFEVLEYQGEHNLDSKVISIVETKF